MTKEEWGQYFSSHWNFNGVKQTGHIAMFPEELPKRLIKMFSFVGETVFDPFVGSGTTSLAAKNLGRNSIGYEINKEFYTIIKDKLQTNLLDFSSKSEVDFIEDKGMSKDDFKNLPYIFNDPHKIDKKIDVKKLQFGSKIDSSKTKKNELFSVKQVISPNRIELSNGLIVRLLGINVNPTYQDQAIEFLKNKFQKRKVFLKYDTEKYDCNNILQCYVYLDNKTFINNHLIRTGFVYVDNDTDYSCKTKFNDSMP